MVRIRTDSSLSLRAKGIVVRLQDVVRIQAKFIAAAGVGIRVRGVGLGQTSVRRIIEDLGFSCRVKSTSSFGICRFELEI